MRWLRRLAIDIPPLRTPQFRLLWLGAVVSAMGSQFSRVGLYVQVYALTGSPTAVGRLGLSGLAGSLAGVFVGSAFIDRYDRRTTLIWTQLAAIVVAAILFFGALSGHPPLWLLQAANLGTWFLAATLGPWFVAAIHGPARQAAIPRLLSAEEIPAASALNQAGWQIGSIVGPALAGVVIALSGVAWAYGVDLASYIFSFIVALLLAPMPVGEEIVERGLKAV